MSIRRFRGHPLGPGNGVGRLALLRPRSRASPTAVADPQAELRRFRRAAQALRHEILDRAERLAAALPREEREILEVHAAMLADSELEREVWELIRGQRLAAEDAAERVLGGMAAALGAVEDPLIAQRAADLRDLAYQLEERLSAGGERAVELVPHGAVLVLSELMPSLVLDAHERGVAGFIVQEGTAVSHGAILAKSFGIPVVRLGSLASIEPYAGHRVLVSATGEVLVDPGEHELQARRPPAQDAPAEGTARALPIRLSVSIVDPAQLGGLGWAGLEGVGLYRSEALFMRYREGFPGEEAQYHAYRRLFLSAGERPVVFRTADLGADKPVEHMRLGPQANPSLGLRAHRLFRFHPEILVAQVRAVLRAAHGPHRLRLLYPMIESLEQLCLVRALVERAMRSLEAAGEPFQRRFEQGLLVETPSAAWSFRRLLREVDFASIGTNDLVQYLFAVERDAVNVADLYRPEHPVVLQVISALAEEAAAAGKPLSVCGEMAADPSLVPLLVGLGVAELAVAPEALPGLRRQLAGLDQARCRALADACLHADTARAVCALLQIEQYPGEPDAALSQGEAIDPICGMVVRRGETPYALRSGEDMHYFCSGACLERFRSGPAGDAGC